MGGVWGMEIRLVGAVGFGLAWGVVLHSRGGFSRSMALGCRVRTELGPAVGGWLPGTWMAWQARRRPRLRWLGRGLVVLIGSGR